MPLDCLRERFLRGCGSHRQRVIVQAGLHQKNGHGLWIPESAVLSDSRGLRLQPGVRCGGLLTEKSCRGLVEFVAVAANFPHQRPGLLKRDVVLLREVVSVVGGVRWAPLEDTAPLLPLRHVLGFRT